VTTLTAKQQSFIDMMQSNEEVARKGFQLLLQRPDYVNFFAALRQAGFFEATTNPGPVRGERENTVRIPYWPALDYLKSVAHYSGTHEDIPVGKQLIDVVRTVSKWRDEKNEPRRNYHTSRVFAEILALLPSSVVTIEDVDLLGEWLRDPYELMLVAVAVDEALLPRLLVSNSKDDWDKAVRVLYHVTAISWREDKSEGEPTPATVVDDYWLALLLRKHAKQIGARAGKQAVEIMMERVREVFSTPLRRDHSSVFRPAVEDDAQNHQWRSAENRVVDGLRDALLGWADQSTEDARAEIKRMLTDDLQIVRRVAIYALGQHWKPLNALYTDILTPELFSGGHTHELYHLVQDHFADMTLGQKAATLKAIKELPSITSVHDPERLRRQSQHQWLSAMRNKGYGAVDDWIKELEADPTLRKLSEHPDFDSYISSWVGPGATPYSPEELVALTKEGITVERLNAFTPRNEWESPTLEGLTSALENAVRSNPSVFLNALSEFYRAKPVYQHAVINALKQAWEEKKDVDWSQGWEQLVNFFERLVGNDDFWERAGDMYQHWVVTAVADSLRAGTSNDDHSYDPGLLPRTQAVIGSLLRHQSGSDAPQDDTMFQAMNTPRGRIIEALYSQALRSARVADKQASTHQGAWQEIRGLFDLELEKCKNANFEFSTLSGAYLPQLQYLDSLWTAEHVEQIFPEAYETNTACALDGLGYASFTQPTYELLASRGIISHALKLDLKGRAGRGKLVERVGAAYLWGIEELDGERFQQLFKTATVEDLEALIRLFWMFRNGNLTDNQRERILAFWDRTLSWARKQPQFPARLISLSSLLGVHISKLGNREQSLLEAVAEHVHVGHETYEFAEQLLRLAPQNPAVVTNILKSLITAHVPDYDFHDRIRDLLAFLAANGQRDEAILISNRLRHLEGVAALFKTLTTQ
jgi:hypothetical protein